MLYFTRRIVPAALPEAWHNEGVIVYDADDRVRAVCDDLPAAVVVANALQAWSNLGLTVDDAFRIIMTGRGELLPVVDVGDR